jgi:hypothetical protein
LKNVWTDKKRRESICSWLQPLAASEVFLQKIERSYYDFLSRFSRRKDTYPPYGEIWEKMEKVFEIEAMPEGPSQHDQLFDELPQKRENETQAS